MTRSVRVALLSAILLVAAVAAFVALRDAGASDGAETTARATTPATSAAPQETARATDGSEGTTDPPAATTEAPAGTTDASPATTDASPTTTGTSTSREIAPAVERETAAERAPTQVTVRGGSPVGGVRELRVRTGDVVDLRITADAADEVHVHGYDVTQDLRPGTAARIRFPARLEGVFEVELHGSGEQIVKLVVEPR